MWLAWWPLWLLGGCSGTFSHSLRNIYVGVSEPVQGLPQFIAVGYIDDQLFVHYDSTTRRKVPRVPWMEKVVEEDPQYWDRNTRMLHGWEQAFQVGLAILQNRYNQSGGFHTLQEMYGCEVSKDGRRGGYIQDAYDGRDFLTFDKETLTWTAADVVAQMSKRKWESERTVAQRRKHYLEVECFEWLQKYLDYGKEVLLRTEAPTVKVTRKVEYDDLETLVCRAHGFYPKDIEIRWLKDWEIWTQEVFRGRVAPNSDGTYHTWQSVKINPKDRDRYRCHVEHDGLQDTLDLAWEEPGASVWPAVGGILAAMTAALALLATVIFYIKKQHEAGYRAASDASNSEMRLQTWAAFN